MADHLGLDFHLVEGLAIVNSNDASDHFWDNDHVSQVRFHYLWFLKWTCFFLGLTKTFNEAERFAFQTMRNPASSSAGEEFHQLLIGHIQKLVKINSSVSILSEGTLLLLLSQFFLVIFCS